MKISNIPPPYPVLYPEIPEYNEYTGYTSGNFDAIIEYDNEKSPGYLILKVEMFLTDQPDLQELINKQKACYALHIEAPSSRFRKLITSTSPCFNCEIVISELHGIITLYPCIISQEDIIGYSSKDFVSHFRDVGSFNFPRGLQLAIAKTYSVELDKLLGYVKPPILVFKSKRKKNPVDPEIIVQTDTNFLKIGLEEKTYNAYLKHCDKRFKFTGLTTIMMPALMTALAILGDDWHNEENHTKFWERYLIRCLMDIEKKEKVTIDLGNGSSRGSLLWTAQQFLKSPYEKCFVNELRSEEED